MKKSSSSKRIVVGVTGSIAAYKACELVRLLVKKGHEVHVVMTANAMEFVTPLTFKTLSRNSVRTGLFSEPDRWEPGHISLADLADIVVVAPCTANVIAKIAVGIADDLLTSTCLATSATLMIAPAMNTGMWENPFVQENISKLQAKGYHILNPESGFLACGTNGTGRMVEVEDIYEKTVEILSQKKNLAGKKILITAGGTREKIDPVSKKPIIGQDGKAEKESVLTKKGLQISLPCQDFGRN